MVGSISHMGFDKEEDVVEHAIPLLWLFEDFLTVIFDGFLTISF